MSDEVIGSFVVVVFIMVCGYVSGRFLEFMIKDIRLRRKVKNE